MAPENRRRSSVAPTRRNFAYQVYGLTLMSPWPLGVRRGSGDETSAVRLVEARTSLCPDPLTAPGGRRRSDWFTYARRPDGSDYIRWSGLSEFEISPDGRRIVCHLLDRGSRETLNVYLLGQVLSFALVKRGIEPLHATAVMIDDEAVAFVGDCGYGKSSLGAAFYQEGCPVLTDDLLAVTERNERLLAYPGPGRIKLLPVVARHLLGTVRTGTRMNPDTAKLVIPLAGSGTALGPGPFPLRAIYVLNAPRAVARRDRITIRPLSPRRAFLALVRNTFNPVVAEHTRLARLLDRAAWVAQKVPLKSLSFPRTWSALPAVRRAIRADLAA